MANNRQITYSQLIGRSVLVLVALPHLKRVYNAVVMEVRYSNDYGGVEKINVNFRGTTNEITSVENVMNLLGIGENRDQDNFIGIYVEEEEAALFGLIERVSINLSIPTPAYTYPSPLYDIKAEIIAAGIYVADSEAAPPMAIDRRDESIRIIPGDLWQNLEDTK